MPLSVVLRGGTVLDRNVDTYFTRLSKGKRCVGEAVKMNTIGVTLQNNR